MNPVLIFALVVLVLLTSSVLAVAQAGEFSLPWYTIDGGATSSQAGSFELSGTIGQPDAGALSGGEFSLAGGFGGSAPTSANRQLYLPIIKR